MWNADDVLFEDQNTGFLANISLSKAQNLLLVGHKKYIREEISKTFKEISTVLKNDMIAEWNFKSESVSNLFSSLDDSELETICKLINQLNSEQKSELLSIEPRFMTQGSFHYRTLNKPAHTPPQQMDIDDGVYIPIEIIEDSPRLGHSILLLIVETALKRAGNVRGWTFESKKNCARLIIDQNTHIDVPMYAVPKDKFIEKETIRKSRTSLLVANESYSSDSSFNIYLDSDCVYLAVKGKECWQKSDPAIICQWFEQAIKEHGEQLRRVCRYLKAWRDNVFVKDGPSSIALMACAVSVFDNNVSEFKQSQDTKPLLECAKNLFTMLDAGIKSPDPTDTDKLFPRDNMEESYIEEVLNAAKDFEFKMKNIFEKNSTFYEAKELITELFGERLIVTRDNFIPYAKEVVLNTEPDIQEVPELARNMKSG